MVIFSPDRLARHYVHQYLLLEEFSRHGCEVLFVHHAYGQSPEEQMLLQLQGIFSQYEHAKITERIRRKITERIRRGRLHQLQAGRAHYSTPPYGYVYVPQREGVPGRIEIHAAEAEVVRQIFHWLVDEALSSHQLAQRLNTLKIPTKHDCGYWQQSVVLSLLRNPLYRGTAYFHRYQTVEPTYTQGFGKTPRKTAPHGFRLRPREEWVPIEMPAIVSAQLFEQAQEQLQHNSQFAKRNSRRQYLLSGLLECQLCGYRLCGKGQRQRRYYYCIGSKEQTRGEQNCVQRATLCAC